MSKWQEVTLGENIKREDSFTGKRLDMHKDVCRIFKIFPEMTTQDPRKMLCPTIRLPLVLSSHHMVDGAVEEQGVGSDIVME